MLTPEKSIELQNIIGSDIMMQLDDVVSRYGLFSLELSISLQYIVEGML